MRALLTSYGSRGDVEPIAALAVALKQLGADAALCIPGDQEFVDLADRAGVEFIPAAMPVKQWIAERSAQAKADFQSMAADLLALQYEAVGKAARGCDTIIATGLMPSEAASQCVAEKMGIGYEHVALCPLFLPSSHHEPFRYPGRRPAPEGADNRAQWAHNAEIMNELFGGAVNAFRASIGLPQVASVRDHVFTDRPLLASDPILWPWQGTDLSHPIQTGAWILEDTRPLPADLLAFLDAGDPPVYVGFGSIAIPTTKIAAQAAIEAIRGLGRRVVLARGWAENALADDHTGSFAIGEVNQQALFPRMAAVIHHGGAGTTTTAARAGAPQVIVPQIVDQPFWAACVARLGIGAAHTGPSPTTESLTAALQIALAPETKAKANAVAGQMPGDGAKVMAKLLLA